MKAYIKAVEYHLPETRLTNEDLIRQFPEWNVAKIESKTGIRVRHIAAPEECASDLGEKAARKLFASGVAQPREIDYLIFLSQSPDYALPSTSCLLQDRLGLPPYCATFDMNMGCSGAVYGLSAAKGLIESGQAKNVLVIVAETYSKYLHPNDKRVRTIFGDAGAAMLVSSTNTGGGVDPIGPFVFGTDGSGGHNLMIKNSGARHPRTVDPEDLDNYLFMHGPNIFRYVMDIMPNIVEGMMKKTKKTFDDIDLFIFHQANLYMMERLREKIGIPKDRFHVDLTEIGNTVSCTVAISLKNAVDAGTLKPGQTALLVGFGVGYSTAACLIRWMPQI